MIKVDAVWLAVEPFDMRSVTEAALARVVKAFGAVRPHHADLFANRRGNRMEVLVHDGIGVWLATRWCADDDAHARAARCARAGPIPGSHGDSAVTGVGAAPVLIGSSIAGLR